MRYVIVCLLKGETLKFHERLTSNVCSKFKVQRQKLPAHFTLKAPFEVGNIEELEKVTEEFCRSHLKTPIKIQGFNHFRNNVIFMDIFPSKEAVEVHNKYIDELEKFEWLTWKEHEGKNKKFHCTIVSKRISNKFNEIWEYVNMFNPKFDLYFDNICILIWRNARWEIHKEYLIMT